MNSCETKSKEKSKVIEKTFMKRRNETSTKSFEMGNWKAIAANPLQKNDFLNSLNSFL